MHWPVFTLDSVMEDEIKVVIPFKLQCISHSCPSANVRNQMGIKNSFVEQEIHDS